MTEEYECDIIKRDMKFLCSRLAFCGSAMKAFILAAEPQNRKTKKEGIYNELQESVS